MPDKVVLAKAIKTHKRIVFFSRTCLLSVFVMIIYSQYYYYESSDNDT